MDTSTIINIILCVLSFILAVISVVTVIVTLKQNNKMIENSTRPYIVVYFAVTNIQNPKLYLCVKNFGQSSAHITKIDCNYSLKEYSYDDDHIPFTHLPGSSMAPGQFLICVLDTSRLFEKPHPLTFTVEYSSDGKRKYKDAFTLDPQAYSDLVLSHPNADGRELRIISHALQDIVEKML